MRYRSQISRHRKRSSYLSLLASTLSVLLRTAFAVVALPKRRLSYVPSSRRFCGLPAVRAETFTCSQARSESGGMKSKRALEPNTRKARAVYPGVIRFAGGDSVRPRSLTPFGMTNNPKCHSEQSEESPVSALEKLMFCQSREYDGIFC